MNADTLTALRETIAAQQAPLKAQYRLQPRTAQWVLSAKGCVDQAALACDVPTHRAVVRAGLHQASGGDGSLACSGDMLLQALVSCAGVTLTAVATALGVSVDDSTLVAEGDLDFRGTLGVDKSVAVGFSAIRLTVTLVTDASEEQIVSLAKLTERYCVVYQTLSKGVPISSHYAR